MAQQARLIEMLAAGILDSTGTAVASGYARFYQPGTTTPITVYSDETATASLSQPVQLDAGGRAEVYTLVPCRLIAKKSDDATTVFDGNPNYVTAQQVSIKNSAVNGGAETTLDAMLSTAAGNLGSYQEATGAQVRSYTSRLRDQEVSVKDYGAAGDGAQDDTTYIQAALDHCAAVGKDLLFPAGTYLVSGQLSVGAITAAKFNIRGVGPKASIIKQSSTSAHILVFSYGVSTDYGGSIRDIGFTASTTSSGNALSFSNTNNLTLQNVEISLYRNGVSAAGSTGMRLLGCSVLNTDGNALAVGLLLGANALVFGGNYTGSSSLGTAISSSAASVSVVEPVVSGWASSLNLSGTRANVSGGVYTSAASGSGFTLSGTQARVKDARIVGSSGTTGIAVSAANGRITSVEVTGYATGVSFTAANCRVSSSTVTGSSGATGISLGAAACGAQDCDVTGFTTGISLGAFSNGRITGNILSTNTTDISINSSATSYVEMNNVYSTLTDATALPQSGAYGRRHRTNVSTTTSSSTTPSYTPTFALSGLLAVNRFSSVSAGGAVTLTINAPATTGVSDGELLFIWLTKDGSAGANMSLTWNAAYVNDLGGGGTAALPASLAFSKNQLFGFKYDSSSSKFFCFLQTAAF